VVGGGTISPWQTTRPAARVLVVAGDMSYLSGYPRYKRWYKDASDLIPIPDHTRRKEMMLEAAAWACMQAPV